MDAPLPAPEKSRLLANPVEVVVAIACALLLVTNLWGFVHPFPVGAFVTLGDPPPWFLLMQAAIYYRWVITGLSAVTALGIAAAVRATPRRRRNFRPERFFRLLGIFSLALVLVLGGSMAYLFVSLSDNQIR